MDWSRRQFLRRGFSSGVAALMGVVLFAEEQAGAKRKFKLPAGNAERTLKQAARQGRVDIVFAAEVVNGVRTPAIKGEYTPSEVFNLMLKDSKLVAVKHQKSGVYLIEKRDPSVASSL